MSHEKNYVIKELTEEMENKFLAKYGLRYVEHRDPNSELIILMDHKIEVQRQELCNLKYRVTLLEDRLGVEY